MNAIDPTDVYSVSRLNHEAKQLLERGLGRIWLIGEISNFVRASSGHWYLTLKDERAQIRCAMFSKANQRTGVNPQNGLMVLGRAQVSLYEPRGDYQLILEQLENAGEGLLRARFEELKQRLNAEGLFDDSRKKPLPDWPKRIGVVTSPTGAAIRDILHILKRRAAAVEVVIYPVPVQGDKAAAQIAAMIALADQRQEVDVLIIARGGGSLEDLWAFNEEVVARAISACSLPTISGVGHEIDVTICDGVADVRAPTPSGAAEIAVGDTQSVLTHLAQLSSRITQAVRRSQQQSRHAYEALTARLQREHPQHRIFDQHQALDEYQERLVRLIRQTLIHVQTGATHLKTRLEAQNPRRLLQIQHASLAQLSSRLTPPVEHRLLLQRQRLEQSSRTLHAVSPLATLERGYAIAADSEGKVISSIADIPTHRPFNIRLKDGQVRVIKEP